MIRSDIMKRARIITRDLKNTIFREEDVIDFINEGIDRTTAIIPECEGMLWLATNSDEPIFLPKSYHYLLAIYCASRLFTQDENDNKASILMNEFEVKMDELKTKVQCGEIAIYKVDGSAVPISDTTTDYVVNNYYNTTNNYNDYDEGVNSIEDGAEIGSDFSDTVDGILDGGTF